MHGLIILRLGLPSAESSVFLGVSSSDRSNLQRRMASKNEVSESLPVRETTFFRSSTYCHILQYNEDEIKSLDDVGTHVILVFLTLLPLQVVFDIEQLNFDDTNKFPDWRLTVDVELEKFRAQWVSVASPRLRADLRRRLDCKMNTSGLACSMSIDFFISRNGGQSPTPRKRSWIWWRTSVSPSSDGESELKCLFRIRGTRGRRTIGISNRSFVDMKVGRVYRFTDQPKIDEHLLFFSFPLPLCSTPNLD